ncbi:MAG: TIGR00296 family protein [Euryarchaeota archaeon]|nr:TIGR00296 family protein [Euryarchaeota archaeon]
MMYEEEDGALAVRLARASIDNAVKRIPMPDIPVPEKFLAESGAFVTLSTYPKHELRGCIGYPGPYFPLKEALVRAAREATRDPRFKPLKDNELDGITVEVSLLTPPVPLAVKNPKDYLTQIKIGHHGLIVERGGFSGLLLPQVPVEQGWGVEEFLAYTCKKAGLFGDAWQDPKTKLSTFTGEVFGEEKPRGTVTRKVLDGA